MSDSLTWQKIPFLIKVWVHFHTSYILYNYPLIKSYLERIKIERQEMQKMTIKIVQKWFVVHPLSKLLDLASSDFDILWRKNVSAILTFLVQLKEAS